MSRYIDADALITKLKEYNPQTSKVKMTQIVVHNMPSIDIVRCKECKWAKANGAYQWCGRLDSTARITPDDFCSYGEREGE